MVSSLFFVSKMLNPTGHPEVSWLPSRLPWRRSSCAPTNAWHRRRGRWFGEIAGGGARVNKNKTTNGWLHLCLRIAIRIDSDVKILILEKMSKKKHEVNVYVYNIYIIYQYIILYIFSIFFMHFLIVPIEPNWMAERHLRGCWAKPGSGVKLF